MSIRQITIASAVALAALSLAGPALAAQADALSYCKADVARLCPGVQMGGRRTPGPEPRNASTQIGWRVLRWRAWSKCSKDCAQGVRGDQSDRSG